MNRRHQGGSPRCCWPPEIQVGQRFRILPTDLGQQVRAPFPPRIAVNAGVTGSAATLSCRLIRGSRLKPWKTKPSVRLRSRHVIPCARRLASQEIIAEPSAYRDSRADS